MSRNNTFDDMLQYFNRTVDRGMKRMVQPRHKSDHKSKSFFDMAIRELTTLPKKRKK